MCSAEWATFSAIFVIINFMITSYYFIMYSKFSVTAKTNLNCDNIHRGNDLQ